METEEKILILTQSLDELLKIELGYYWDIDKYEKMKKIRKELSIIIKGV